MEFQEMYDLMVESTTATMPFSDFHRQAEKDLGHEIYTHEFGSKGWTNINLKIAKLIRDEGYSFPFHRDGGPLETLFDLHQR
jgi:hypothetical protein